MFEYGMRLGREVRTLGGLQKQVNCYLAALNCLRLIRPDYAWIVQPSSGSTVSLDTGHTSLQLLVVFITHGGLTRMLYTAIYNSLH